MSVSLVKRPAVGDVITYVDFLGGRRTVYVTAVDDDIKNGRPGFDGHLIDDPDFLVWGYDSQIV